MRGMIIGAIALATLCCGLVFTNEAEAGGSVGFGIRGRSASRRFDRFDRRSNRLEFRLGGRRSHSYNDDVVLLQRRAVRRTYVIQQDPVLLLPSNGYDDCDTGGGDLPLQLRLMLRGY